MGQSIFTFCNGVLCKWAGDHFENATLAEQRELGGIEHLSPDINGTINGWTKHDVSTDLSVEIGKDLTLRVKKGKTPFDAATVELDRAGQPAQEIWNVNGEPRMVSWWKYRRAFSGEEFR